jgi:hypothetical protein
MAKKYRAYLANLGIEVPVFKLHEEKGQVEILVSDIPKDIAMRAAIAGSKTVKYWYGANAGGNRLIDPTELKKPRGALVVKKVQDEYVIGVSERDAKGHDLPDRPAVMMWVQLHHNEDAGTPVRISLTKNPIGQPHPKDYHFEESRPEIVEAIALAMLEAVKLARAAK